MGSVRRLKYAIYSEWSCDPPAGGVTIYYSAWGERYSDLIDPLEEITEHLEYSLYDEELDELQEMNNKLKPTKRRISEYYFENGGVGGGISNLAEGNAIVEVALDFLNDLAGEEDDWEDEEENDDSYEKEIIEKAQAHPENYDAVVELLELVDEKISDHNDGQY